MKNKKYLWLNLTLSLSIILPILVLILWAFTARWPWPQLIPNEFTLRGIQELLQQGGSFAKVIVSSVSLSLMVAFLSVVIALMTARAYLFIQSKTLKKIIYVCISLPYLIPALVFAMGIHQIMIRTGLANSFGGILIAHLIYSLPYASYLILNAYQSFGFKFEEQAYLLGANEREAFFQVTLPLLLPVMASSFSMSYVVSFSQYFLTLLLGGGQVTTFSILIFPYLQNNDRTIASVYALVFLIITFLIFTLFNRLSKSLQKKYQLTKYY